MKRFIEGLDRSQTTLLPECIDDYVDEDNSVPARSGQPPPGLIWRTRNGKLQEREPNGRYRLRGAAPMRAYRNALVDNARWARFEGRPDDVVISTPAKCGTTWMQNIVGMLLLGEDERDKPLAQASPWLDIKTYTDEEMFDLLEAQKRRRYVKTHTPLDGLPWRESWTYITVFRHPLDAALSWRDHRRNLNREHIFSLVAKASSAPTEPPPSPLPTEPRDFLTFWISNEDEPDGSSLGGLKDYANSLTVAWSRRSEPNVHLFHYSDLWQDLGGQVSRLAHILDVPLDADRHAAIVEAVTLDSMRSRAEKTAPYGDTPIFNDPTSFFQEGGTRGWRSLLTPDEISTAERRLAELAGEEAAAWALRDADAAPQ
jgi:aryl sulfotransferase